MAPVVDRNYLHYSPASGNCTSRRAVHFGPSGATFADLHSPRDFLTFPRTFPTLEPEQLHLLRWMSERLHVGLRLFWRCRGRNTLWILFAYMSNFALNTLFAISPARLLLQFLCLLDRFLDAVHGAMRCLVNILTRSERQPHLENNSRTLVFQHNISDHIETIRKYGQAVSLFTGLLFVSISVGAGFGKALPCMYSSFLVPAVSVRHSEIPYQHWLSNMPGGIDWVGNVSAMRASGLRPDVDVASHAYSLLALGSGALIMKRLNLPDKATAWKHMEFDSTLGYPGEGPVCPRCLGDRDTLCGCDRPNHTASSSRPAPPHELSGPYGRWNASSVYSHLNDLPSSIQVRNTFVEVGVPSSSRTLRPTVSEPAGGSSVANGTATGAEAPAAASSV